MGVSVVLLVLLVLSDVAFGRMRWAERDGKPVFLHPRRFGQEHPKVIDKLAIACPGAICGRLAGGVITPLLALQPECSQQDFADSIINASRQFDPMTQSNMITLAREYRNAEKNTPPDFSTNPPTNRNSVFCTRGPANAELHGIAQQQDPANDPDVFFDPATGTSVLKGSQPNTEPFGGAAPSPSSKVPTNTTVPSPSNTVASPGSPSPFGSCSVPQIKFGVGFDNRKETSFEPVDNSKFS